MTHDHMSEEMRNCIENCLDCHRLCVETTTHCLTMGGRHAEASHIRGLLDCAQICATSADFMLRQSSHHAYTCGVCAEICKRCADDCERLAGGDPLMLRCAEMCRRCAESCHGMSQSATMSVSS